MKSFLLAAVLAAVSVGALAQPANYPNRPIRLLVPFEAGGTIDALGREIAGQITKQSGINIYIENKPGANSLIGTVEAAKAAPDGYTVVNVSPSIVLNPLLKAKLPYEMKNFTPVTALGVGTGYLVVVRKELPVNSVAELQALASKQELTYGTPGIGNAIHLATEAFTKRLGVKLLHVPYKGSSSALNAIVAGQVDVMLLSPATVIPLAEGNKLRVLAFTGDKRSKEFAQVPTVREAGFDDFVIKGTWVGWFVPVGTPPETVNFLHREVVKALKDPKVAKALTEGGFDPDGRTPAEFARFVQAETQRYGEVIRATGIQSE